MWRVLCSYSSNRYPAETDQQDQEMRNINEEVEGWRVGGGEWCRGGCLGAAFSSLFVIIVQFNSVLVLFILSPSPFPIPAILSDSSSSLWILYSLYSTSGAIAFILHTLRFSITIVGNWVPSSSDLYNRIVANGRLISHTTLLLTHTTLLNRLRST